MSKSNAPASALGTTYTPKERNAYMVGLFGQNMIYNIINVFTSYYLADVLMVPASAVSTILLIAQVWDAFNDPIMGTIVDRTRSKHGKCRPYLMIMPVVIGVMTILCFSLPTYDADASDWDRNGVLLLAAVFYIFWGMTYTSGDIPIWSISSLMTKKSADRQKLQSAGRLAAYIGTAAVMLGFQPAAFAVKAMLINKSATDAGYTGFNYNEVAAEATKNAERLVDVAIRHGWSAGSEDFIQTSLADEKKAFLYLAIALTVIATITFQAVGIFCRERIAPSAQKNGVIDNFKMMFRNKPYRQILLSGILGGTRNITMLVAMGIVTFYFASKDPTLVILYLVLLGGGLFGGMGIVTAFIPKLLQKHSKKKLYNLSNMLEFFPNVFMFLLFIFKPDGLADWYLLIPMAVMFTLKGICLGLFNTLQTVMIGDAVDYEDYTNRIRPDAVFYSGQTFIVKIGTGLSSAIYYGLRAIVGYSDDNAKLVQEYVDSGDKTIRETMGSKFFETIKSFFEHGKDAPTGNIVHHASWNNSLILTDDQLFVFMALLFFCVSIIPAIGNILSLIPTWRYALDTDEYDAMHAKLQARRAAEGEEVEEAE
ncbi:MAG: MFS transporter [Oscillospiraceae bacterium]|jgi:Na+/melibiose symporter-like transporter|nr:MFS transporter [Oscillospiraceae bacterium]